MKSYRYVENCAMAKARPSQPTADRNLLFGILALQMEFIHRDDLVASMNAWVLDKTKPLGQILCDQGSLGAEEYALLEALIRKHLERHGNDPGKSLAAVNSTGSFPTICKRSPTPTYKPVWLPCRHCCPASHRLPRTIPMPR